MWPWLLNVNHGGGWVASRLVHDDDRVENQLLLQRVGIDIDDRVGLKVWLVHLDLTKRVKEPNNAHWSSADGVAEKAGNELLGKHLGGASWNTWMGGASNRLGNPPFAGLLLQLFFAGLILNEKWGYLLEICGVLLPAVKGFTLCSC